MTSIRLCLAIGYLDIIYTHVTLRGLVLLLKCRLHYVPIVYYRAFQRMHQEHIIY